MLQVDIGSGKKSMNPRAGGPFKSATGSFNVARTTARQGGNHGAANFARQRPHRVKVAFRCDRKSCLNDVHAQAVELVPHAYLLFAVHTAARRLLSIAQGGVKYGYMLWCYVIPRHVIWFRQVILPCFEVRAPGQEWPR